jgi:hypothetical protein
MDALRRSLALALLWLLTTGSPAYGQAEDVVASGDTQLGVILEDRPQLAAVLRGRDELREWLVTQFNGKAPAPLWDPTEPVSGRAAEHEYPSRGGAAPAGTAVIRVNSQASGWDQLAGLVFELHNVRRSERFAEIHRAAVRGQIGKDEYVRRSLAEEFAALRATREFLERHVGALPESAQGSSPLYRQVMETGDNFEQHLESQEKNGAGLKQHFEQLYEREVIPERRRLEDSSP